MGGRGSGRPPERYAVCDSRSLSVGELLARTPAGKPNCEISWRTLTGGRLTARLSFRPVGTQRASERATQTIELRYWPTLTDPFTRQAIVVPGGGRAPSILCPVCGAAVRKLYAPPGADRFACRTCHGLVYRRPRGPDPALELPTVLGPLLPELFEGPMPERSPTNGGSRHRSLADLLKAVQDERPLYDQELRAWCLLLGRRGLSCRLIARALGTSKSTVQRHLAAGQAGIDLHALIRERLSRADDEQGTPLAGLSPREQLRELDRRARGFGLYRRITEPEEKLFA